jgi:hypothetical protein
MDRECMIATPWLLPAQSPAESVPLLGRRDQVIALTAALRAKTSCLIVGPKGIGKTRLLQESLQAAGQPFVCLERPEVLHQLLVGLADRLSCPAGRLTSVALKARTLNALRTTPRCLVLENVTSADPRMYRFLQHVYYLPGVSLIVTAESRECLGYLRKLLWDPREEIALKPLSGSDALSLFEAASAMYRLESFDLDAFRRKVLTAARGNPGQILTMCRMASRSEYQDGRHIKFLPLRMDALTSSVS